MDNLNTQEIQQTESTMRQNEAILSLFYDLPFIGMAITSPETLRWVKFNDRLCEILGYSHEELVEISWSEITHPDDLDLDMAEFEKTLRGESEGYVMDKRFIRKDGQIIYATIDVKCIRKSDRTVDFFVATIQDISDRKVAEAKQKQIEKALTESENRYREVVQTQIDFLLQSLPDTTITFANESLCRALGKPLNQVIGLKWLDFQADVDIIKNILLKISELSPINPTFLQENCDLRSDGQVGWTQWVNQGIFDEHGQLIGIQSAGRDITAIKNVENALQKLNEELELKIEERTIELTQSEARNFAILQALPDMLLILKPDGTCLQCILPATENKSKYLPIKHHLSEVLSPETLAEQLQLYEKAIATGERQIYEHQISKYGETVYEEVRISPYGKDKLLVIVRDISDRKISEQQLQNVTDRLTLAVKSAAIGIWEWDIVHNQLIWDEPTFELYGVTPDPSIDAFSAWVSRVHPHDRAIAESEVQRALEGVKDYDIEFRIVLPNGNIRYIKAYALVQRNDAGEPQRMIGINFDISDRKLAEKALIKSETHLKVAQRIGKIGSWEYEINTGKLTWTDEIFHIYGLEPSSDPPNYDQLKLYIHPDDWEHFNNTVQTAINSVQSYDLEHRVVHGDGKVIYVQARGEMIYDLAGQLTHIIGTAMDITDRKLAEAEILESARQLENTNRELESFAYSVSHDLRAPLRHMNGFVNALEMQLKRNEALNDPKISHYLEVIASSSQKMGNLIDGLLMLSRYGRRPLEAKSVSIRDLVDEAIEMIRSDPSYNRKVRFAIGDLPNTVGDPTLLQQVFRNLIGNAVKFSRNEPQPLIEIDSLPDQTIRIKDNGVGFQMEYADKLFGAFQRLHHEKDFEGTGIGLAIVQRIVQRHGGSIWAESYPNQGATFFLKI